MTAQNNDFLNELFVNIKLNCILSYLLMGIWNVRKVLIVICFLLIMHSCLHDKFFNLFAH